VKKKTMPFVKGDLRINRNGRPKNAEPDLLRNALAKEGKRRGIDFWDKVAEYAYRDKNVMIAVLKKFVPDTSIIQGEGFGDTQIIIVKDKVNRDISRTVPIEVSQE
jgi:hypothetical protein